jgi:hypothetical protein
MDNTEDILKRLREQGIPVGEWSDRPATPLGDSVFHKQLAILEKLKVLLGQQIQMDLAKEAELQDAFTRVEKAKELARGRK